MHPQVSKARARHAALSRSVNAGERSADDPVVISAKAELTAANLGSFIEKTLAAAPPLTDEQRTRLAELLRPARRQAVVAERIAELDGGGDHAA